MTFSAEKTKPNRYLAPSQISEMGSHARRQNIFIPPRNISEILLEDSAVSTEPEFRQNLEDLGRMNAYLGGVRSITDHLYPMLLRHRKPTTVIDLATGSGQIPLKIAQWANEHHREVTLYCLDNSARHLSIANDVFGSTPHIYLMQADALRLPFKNDSIDYFISSLFLHQLNPTQVVAFLRQIYAKTRKALIFSDVQRGWLPYIGFKMLGPVFVRNHLTRHQNGVSILRGYTPDELLDLAHEAGLPNPRVIKHFPWRMTLVVEKDQ